MGVKRQLKKALNAEQIEKNKDKLHNDYLRFVDFSESQELKEYNQLNDIVNSNEFIGNKKNIESLSFKASSLREKENAYKKLCVNKSIKAYLKLEGSKELASFTSIEASDIYKEFKQLESLVKSPAFSKKENRQQFQQFKQLRRNPDIKFCNKFRNSKNYKYYNSVADSELLRQYNKLSNYIDSDEFKNEKAFLLNKNRYQTTDDYKKLERYNQLRETDNIKMYLKYKDTDAFDSLKEWELTFEDDFNTSSLDENKWISKYNSGNELLGDNYSLEGDKHFFTEGSNLEFSNSKLKIVAREEKIVGKQWNGLLGFSEQQFDYTSGIISTGNKFRQQYGRFEAKVKISGMPVNQCFWLMSDYSVPHIDIFKTLSGKELVTSVFSDIDKGLVNKFKGVDFTKDFFIYSVIWEPNKIVWLINDVPVWEQKDNIPQEPLFMSLGTCIYSDLKSVDLPAVMEVDWVRCYKKSK